MCPWTDRGTRFDFRFRKVGDIGHDTEFIYVWVGDFLWSNNLQGCEVNQVVTKKHLER